MLVKKDNEKNFSCSNLLILILLCGYFLGGRIFLGYYSSQNTKLINSVVVILPEGETLKEVKMKVGSEWRELDFVDISSKREKIYFAQFHDISGVEAFEIGTEKERDVWLAKKISLSKKPFLLFKLKKNSQNSYPVGVSLLKTITVIGNIFIFFLDILILGLTFFPLKRYFSPTIIWVLLGGLFFSNLSIQNLLSRVQGGGFKILLWLLWIGDVFFVLGGILWFLYKKNIKLTWKGILIIWVVFVVFWNVSTVNLLWNTQRFYDFKTIIQGIMNGKEYRDRNSYSQYGALYDVGIMIRKILNYPSKIGFPGNLFPVFGNGSLVRRFIYPNIDMIVSINCVTNSFLLLQHCEQKGIEYLVVVKKGMDSYAPWRCWPDFEINCEGIYFYDIKSGNIKFVAENYKPDKHLTNSEEYLMIKLRGKK